jgi:hypothetical protein
MSDECTCAYTATLDCPRHSVKSKRVELSTFKAKAEAADFGAKLERERANKLEERAEKAESSWRCFHCNEIFTDEKEARLHFGNYGETGTPACKVDAAHLRDLEDQLRSYRNEDTDLHRQLQSMETEHSIALRREEEKGYAKGLKDYTALKARCEKLEGYAVHKSYCMKVTLCGDEPLKCTCGLDELRKQGVEKC